MRIHCVRIAYAACTLHARCMHAACTLHAPCRPPATRVRGTPTRARRLRSESRSHRLPRSRLRARYPPHSLTHPHTHTTRAHTTPTQLACYTPHLHIHILISGVPGVFHRLDDSQQEVPLPSPLASPAPDVAQRPRRPHTVSSHREHAPSPPPTPLAGSMPIPARLPLHRHPWDIASKQGASCDLRLSSEYIP